MSGRALARRLLRAWTRPWPDRGVNGWLLREPGWLVAVAACGFYGLLVFGGWWAVTLVTHHSPSVLQLTSP